MKTLLTLLISTLTISGTLGLYLPHSNSTNPINSNSKGNDFIASISINNTEQPSGLVTPIKYNHGWFGVILTQGKINFYQITPTTGQGYFYLLDSINTDNTLNAVSGKALLVGDIIYYQFLAFNPETSKITTYFYQFNLKTEKASELNSIEIREDKLSSFAPIYDNVKMHLYNNQLVVSYENVWNTFGTNMVILDINTNKVKIAVTNDKIANVIFVKDTIYYLFKNQDGNFNDIGSYNLTTNKETIYDGSGYNILYLIHSSLSDKLEVTTLSEDNTYSLSTVIINDDQTISLKLDFANTKGICRLITDYNTSVGYYLVFSGESNHNIGYETLYLCKVTSSGGLDIVNEVVYGNNTLLPIITRQLVVENNNLYIIVTSELLDDEEFFYQINYDKVNLKDGTISYNQIGSEISELSAIGYNEDRFYMSASTSYDENIVDALSTFTFS